MRILFVCHRLPFPPNRGGKIRPFHMIEHLSRTHSVVVASLAHTRQELDEGTGLSQYCEEVLAEIVPNATRWLRAGLYLPTATPSSAAYFRVRQLLRRVQDAWRRKPFDAVWVHCAFAAQYAVGLRGGFRVLDYGDMDSAKWRSYSQARHWPISLGYAFEARKLRKLEARLARQFHHCVTTTQGELEEFQTLNAGVPCVVIPNGVDSSYFHPRWRVSAGSPVIAFVGRMDYFPNVQAVSDFGRLILPRVRQAIPNAQFRIIGSNPSAAVQRLARIPGVVVTGTVSDVRPHLADATVAVAPLKIARGTQNKILQSLAMGVPVVASPQAANGVLAVPGEHLLVGDGPEHFAEQVVLLLRNEPLRERLADAGRQQVVSAHSWPTSMNLVDEILGMASPFSTAALSQSQTGTAH